MRETRERKLARIAMKHGGRIDEASAGEKEGKSVKFSTILPASRRSVRQASLAELIN